MAFGKSMNFILSANRFSISMVQSCSKEKHYVD